MRDVRNLSFLNFFNILLVWRVGIEEVVTDVRAASTSFLTRFNSLEWDFGSLVRLVHDGTYHLGMLMLRRELSLSLVLDDAGRNLVSLG